MRCCLPVNLAKFLKIYFCRRKASWRLLLFWLFIDFGLKSVFVCSYLYCSINLLNISITGIIWKLIKFYFDPLCFLRSTQIVYYYVSWKWRSQRLVAQNFYLLCQKWLRYCITFCFVLTKEIDTLSWKQHCEYNIVGPSYLKVKNNVVLR